MKKKADYTPGKFEELMARFKRYCYSCKGEHKKMGPNGSRIILTVNNIGRKWVLLCAPCGMEFIKNAKNAPVRGEYNNAKKKDGKDFGNLRA